MRNAGAVNVGVEQADLAAGSLQAEGECNGDRAFANAAFAGADGDDALGGEADLTEFLWRAVMDGEVDLYLGEAGQASFEKIGHALLGFLPERRGVRRKGERQGCGRAGDFEIADLLLAGGGQARFGVFEIGESFL